MLTFEPPLTTDEIATLPAFRRTARAVHSIVAPVAQLPLTLDLREPAAPRLSSFPEDTVRSLALAVRQAYMPSERTHFDRICGIVGRTTNTDAKAYIESLRQRWDFALTSPPGLQTGERTYGGREVFDTWLYARAVHQDANKQSDAESLDKMAPLPTWVVQGVVRDLALCIVLLDVAVADALGEDPLPNLESGIAGDRPFQF